MRGIKADKTLNVRGLTGPRASLVTKSILETMEDGNILRVVASAPDIRENIASLCKGLGYELLEVAEDGGTIYFTIQK